MKKKYIILIAVVVVLVSAAAIFAGIRFYQIQSLKNRTITIGALLPLSGKLSASGEDCKAGLQIALRDIRKELADRGSNKIVKVLVQDTKLDSAHALTQMRNFARDKDIKIIIGPLSSEMVLSLSKYAVEEEVILLSPTSSAPNLAIPGDNLYRMVSDDTRQAEALATLMKEDGIELVVPFARADEWGDGFRRAFVDKFEAMGGEVIEGIRYEVNKESFIDDVDTLTGIVNLSARKLGRSKIAVLVLAFEEVKDIFKVASVSNPLTRIKWYGSDAVTLDKNLVKDTEFVGFAEKVGFPCPVYASGENEISNRLQKEISDVLKREPSISALTAFDALKLAVETVIVSGFSKDINILKTTLDQSADSYYGATGWCAFNVAGDRSIWNYDFWSIHNGQWVRSARFQHDVNFGNRMIRFAD